MTRHVTRSLVMIALATVVVAGASAMSPASAGPPASWGATTPSVNTHVDLRSCNRLNCARFGHVSPGKVVTDICREAAASGGTLDLVFSRASTGGATAHRVGYIPTQFLNAGRTGNLCFATPGARVVVPRLDLTLRSCPAPSGCPASGSADAAETVLLDLCFFTVAGRDWDVVYDVNNLNVGFVASENLVPGDGLTVNSCV